VLAIGSPTFPVDPEGYKEWTSTFEWKKLYDIEYKRKSARLGVSLDLRLESRSDYSDD
jgi:hypothetical protein